MKKVFTKEQWATLSDKDKAELLLLKKMWSKPKSYYFWEIVHNARDLVLWLVLLPFTPIIAIIQAIRGDL